MARPSVKPPEERLRIVLSVLRGEVSVAEASRRERVSETTISKWRDVFLEGGRDALVRGGRLGPSGGEQRLLGEIDDLKIALGEAHAELRVLKKGGLPGSGSRSWR